jgi:hypothetical protein
MKIKSLESKKEKFNRISMTRTWSVPLHIKIVIQNRRTWEEGLTSRQLLQKVKESLRNNKYSKKANKIKLGSIYDGVSKINLYHEPPFYISSFGKLISTGKYEYRYFVPVTDTDIQNERGKQIRMGTLKFAKEKNVREFGEEIEKEEKVKVLQEIKQTN